MRLTIAILIIINFSSRSYCQTFEDYFNSGFTKDSLGEYENAIEDFDKAISLNPDCEACYFLRYNTARKIDNYSSAIDDLNILLYNFNNNKKNDFLYLERGIVKVQINDYNEAIEDFGIYIDLFPKAFDGYMNRGITKFITEDYKGSIFDLTKAIGIKPKNDQAYYYRGNSKKQLKDYRGAIADYNNAILLKPKNEDYYDSRIRVKLLMNNYAGAIEDCNILLKINPNNGPAYWARGLAKIGLKQKNSACIDFSKSGELGFEKAYDMIEEYCQ